MKNQKEKICYLIHTPWRHIFQRPHIFALQLQKDFDCTVIEKYNYKDLKKPQQKVLPDRLVSIMQLPKSGENRIMHFLSELYTKVIVSTIAKKSDILWLCHPQQYTYIPKRYRGKIVYDCMDLHKYLGTDKSIEATNKFEEKLIDRADVIFASSSRIVEVINKPEKTLLVRNGYSSGDEMFPVKIAEQKAGYKIAYFGTVSSWFDFDLLSRGFDTYPEVTYKIIGPVNSGLAKKNTSSGFVYTGPVEHSMLHEEIMDCDALIMPFVVNELILAVDPVKMYEYINFGKCIISVWYPEIDRFSPFVYFYRSHEEYCELLEELIKKGFPAKYSDEERKEFLNCNSWDERYQKVLSGLSSTNPE